jgi:predicted nuclease with TOPRIM domain
MRTALARKLDAEEPDMEPAQEIKLLTEVAELRSDVRHIQSDVTDIKARFDKVDQKFDKIDQRFERIDQRFEKVDQRFNEIIKSITSAQLWAYGLYLAMAGTLLYVIARSAKWL